MNIDEMQAGREMDALIAEKVMGFTVKCILGRYQIALFDVETGERAPGMFKNLPYYSTDIAAAWEVRKVIQLLGFDAVNVHITTDNPYCQFIKPIYEDSIEQYIAYAETDALAICRAALKAVMKGVK
jgi:hypothetical protein